MDFPRVAFQHCVSPTSESKRYNSNLGIQSTKRLFNNESNRYISNLGIQSTKSAFQQRVTQIHLQLRDSNANKASTDVYACFSGGSARGTMICLVSCSIGSKRIKTYQTKQTTHKLCGTCKSVRSSKVRAPSSTFEHFRAPTFFEHPFAQQTFQLVAFEHFRALLFEHFSSTFEHFRAQLFFYFEDVFVIPCIFFMFKPLLSSYPVIRCQLGALLPKSLHIG